MIDTGYICGRPEETSQDEDPDYYPSKFGVKEFSSKISRLFRKLDKDMFVDEV